MKATASISFEYANNVLRYDPETGLLWWKKRARGRKLSRPAGTVKRDGYVGVVICGTNFPAHRIAYLLHYGDCPLDMVVDHENHIRADNRISNLRLVSTYDNARNVSVGRNRTTGVIGVYYNKGKKKFAAQIWAGGKAKYLGLYQTLEDAAEARRKANELYGYHKNHGK